MIYSANASATTVGGGGGGGGLYGGGGGGDATGGGGGSNLLPRDNLGAGYEGDGRDGLMQIVYISPGLLTVTGGNNQTAVHDQPFPQRLSARVTELDGVTHRSINQRMYFTITGGSATFAGSPDPKKATVTTDYDTGVATAPALVAGPAAGPVTVVVSAGGTQPRTMTLRVLGAPAAVSAASGAGQNVATGKPFAPITALVTDSAGAPVSGTTVTWSVSGAATLTATTSVTGADGKATAPIVTAGTTAGSVTVRAAVAGVTAPATFTGAVAAPGAVTAASGNNQTVVRSAPFAPMVATVTDTAGKPLSGVTVTFDSYDAPYPNGAYRATATTGADGRASSPSLVAPARPGSVRVSASVAGVGTAAFTGTVVNPAAAGIAVTGGNNQTAMTRWQFDRTFTAVVVDAANKPIWNAPVTWTVTGPATFSGGATTKNETTFSDGSSNPGGVYAGTTPGTVTITASTPGVAAKATFTATVTAAPKPAAVAVASGNNQSVVTGKDFSTLVATVTDSAGKPVYNETVTWTVSGAATFTGSTTATSTTWTDGTASAPVLRAGSTAGSVTVRATVNGVTTAATFTGTVTAAPAGNKLVMWTGDGQSVYAGDQFSRMMVKVVDGADNGVGDATVTYTVSGPATFAGGATTVPVKTSSGGYAETPTLTAGSSAGTVTVRASVSGIATPATFTGTVKTRPVPGTMVLTSGDNQAVPVTADRFTSVPTVTVRDTTGKPLWGAPVTWTITGPAHFGGGKTITESTFSDGTSPSGYVYTEGTAGTVTITATTPGVPTKITFTLRVTASAARTATPPNGPAACEVYCLKVEGSPFLRSRLRGTLF